MSFSLYFSIAPRLPLYSCRLPPCRPRETASLWSYAFSFCSVGSLWLGLAVFQTAFNTNKYSLTDLKNATANICLRFGQLRNSFLKSSLFGFMTSPWYENPGSSKAINMNLQRARMQLCKQFRQYFLYNATSEARHINLAWMCVRIADRKFHSIL